MNVMFMPVLALRAWQIGLIVVVILLAAGLVALYFYGRKLQKRQAAAQEQMQVGAQTVSLLVIDKKMMKLKEAGFPQVILDQTPRYLRGSKVPVVKAKIGPKITTLMCDPDAFNLIPVKREVKVVMNGIYIMEVKGSRGGFDKKPEKVGFFKRMKNKIFGEAKDDEKAAKGKEKGEGKSQKGKGEAKPQKEKGEAKS